MYFPIPVLCIQIIIPILRGIAGLRVIVQIDFIIPATGQRVSNIMSTTPDGDLYLIFTFEWPHPELEAGSVEVKELERERGELSRGIVPRTVEVARGLVRDGLLHLE